jgi:hypothetical protein
MVGRRHTPHKALKMPALHPAAHRNLTASSSTLYIHPSHMIPCLCNVVVLPFSEYSVESESKSCLPANFRPIPSCGAQEDLAFPIAIDPATGRRKRSQPTPEPNLASDVWSCNSCQSIPSFYASRTNLLQVLEARDRGYTLGLDEVCSRPEKKCLQCQIDFRGRTYRIMLSYNKLLSLPDGEEALRTYFEPQIVEPRWWERLFRARKSYSLPANTLWPMA